MRHFVPLFRAALAMALLAGLAACGSVSGLSREAGDAPSRIADFERVEVLDFTADEPVDASAEADRREKHAAQLAQAEREFADKIAAAIAANGSFHEVVRSAGDPPSLRVTGVIHRYDEGNIVARGLTGFAGQSHFDATVTVSDAASGQVLATLSVDRHSWPLPVGASASTLQTPNYFMNNAAAKVAAELAARKRGSTVR